MERPRSSYFFSFPNSLLFAAASTAFLLVAFYELGFNNNLNAFYKHVTAGIFFFILAVICWLYLIYIFLKNKQQ